MSTSMEQKRNVALIGHGGAGKTMLSEAMLYLGGAITRMGSIEDGNTVSDTDPEEIKRRYSIRSSVLPFDFNGYRINLIDCPGYLDFIGETISALHSVDSAIIVVDGQAGVEPQTRSAWKYCDEMKKPRLIFISGLDKENGSFSNALSSCRQVFGKKVAPLCITMGSQANLKGVINVLTRKAYIKDGDKIIEQDAPADMQSALDDARAELVESIVELDDELMMRYMDDEQISDEDLTNAMLAGTLRGDFCPAVGGAGKQMIGVRNLLDLIISSLPHPGFRQTISGNKPNGAEEVRPLREDAPFCARVFKLAVEGQLGELYWLRVFSGLARPGDTVINTITGEQEKLGNLLVMRGKTREDLTQAGAGDIVATVKMKNTGMGHTLAVKEQQIVLPPIKYPNAVAYECVDVEDKNDLEKVMSTLSHLTAMDPTLRVVQDEETMEQVVYGMGQLHIDITTAQVRKKTNVDIKWKKPRVPYRETITMKAEAQGKFKKQTGGRGKYGDAHIRLEPKERGEGFEFVDAIVGGVVPNRFIPAVEKGIIDSMHTGPLSGSRVIDLSATLFYGSYHNVDSDELSFKVAASMGFKAAFEKANPILLEPIYNVTIYTPDAFMGDVMGDINSRRGRVGGMDSEGDLRKISAQIPLGELYQYINTLRSVTQGQGSFEMAFSHYEQVPGNVQSDIIKAYQTTRQAEAKD
jgi:elongation factor G